MNIASHTFNDFLSRDSTKEIIELFDPRLAVVLTKLMELAHLEGSLFAKTQFCDELRNELNV